MNSGENQKTILLVEDEAVTAMAEKLVLEKYGNKVLTASTGEEAIATVEKTPDIDLILMDINLGSGIDGAEAAEIILRAHDLPVLFVSSHGEPEIVARTKKITSYGFVVKHSCNSVLDASVKMAFKLFEAKTREKERETQREAALKALRESEARYWMLFSGASDGILVADSKTRQFRYANPAICRMLGYTEEEFPRMSVADIHPKESLKHVLAEFESLARGETESTPDLPCLRKDGTVFYTTISHSAMVLEGRDYHAGFFHDVTERKRAEEEIKRQLLEKEILLREVHHRIKNNIASIGGLISLQMQSVTNAEAITVLQDAVGRVNSMRILYDKLLFSTGYNDIPVKNYVESLVDAIVAVFPDNAWVTVEKQITDFHLDAKRLFPLGLIINELITNKMKYAFSDRQTGSISISLTNADNLVMLAIQDSGVGLPEGFDIDQSQGFGLRLVKMLSDQLGGSFSLDPHQGARCRVEFPA